MEHKLVEVAVHLAAGTHSSAYLRIQSAQVYFSPVAPLSSDNYLKCAPVLELTPLEALTVEVWSYEPQKMLQKWHFQGRQVLLMKQKHITSNNNWSLFLRKELRSSPNMDKQNTSALENQQVRPNSTRSKDKHGSKRQSKAQRPKKHSVKKALKNTIDYLMQQDSTPKDSGLKSDLPERSKTGKCTPAIERVAHFKHSSGLFNEYGLNVSELNQRYYNKQIIGQGSKVSSKRKTKIR